MPGPGLPGAVPAPAARRALLWGSAGGFLGFYFGLAAIPALAGERGGDTAPGVLTAALMLSTVATQAAVPALLRRATPSSLLVTGLWLLGAPALLYGAVPGVPGLVMLTLLRGVGFGLMTVIGSMLVARYAVDGARGRALGLYGLVSSGSGAIAPALGLAALRGSPWLAGILAAAPPMVAALALAGRLPAVREVPREVEARARHTIPILLFLPAAVAFGGVYSYVPQLGTARGAWLLVAFGVCFSIARLVPGHLVDRGVPAGVVGAGLVPVAGLGVGLLALDGSVVETALGAALAGLGIGGICTTTLVMMIARRAGEGDDAQASSAWNIVYDAGTGVGGLALGLVAGAFGIHAVFLAAAALMVAVGAPAAVAALSRP